MLFIPCILYEWNLKFMIFLKKPTIVFLQNEHYIEAYDNKYEQTHGGYNEKCD